MSALLIDGVQNAFVSRTSRLLASLAVLLGLAAVGLAIRRVGPLLERRFSADDTDAIQAVAFSLAAAAASAFLVIVWHAVDDVETSFETVKVGPTQGVLALVGVLTLIVAYTITRVSKGLLETRGGDVLTAHRREVIHHLIQLAVYLFAAVFVMSLAGVNPGDLLVGAGVIGLVVGLAARQTLGAVLAGFVLIFARPFEVGDWIVVEDREGVVTDVSLFNTRLRTYDDEHVLLPNDEVTATQVVNRSKSGRLRVSVEVGVDYDADVTRAAEVAEQAMRDCEVKPLLTQPEPVVVGKQFDDSAVILECRFWISNPSAPRKWQTQTAVIEAIKNAFDAEGIKIPFPQRELLGREEDGGLRLAGNGVDVATGDSGSSDTDGDSVSVDGERSSVESQRASTNGDEAEDPQTDGESADGQSASGSGSESESESGSEGR
ncbi:mechanosensitive ion channel family protein [Halorientalis halophila]|uniref:mechanosensitive ion channel family protein n=1 Tax=Halorientalis halophila TaxID=3108499 RepID=UPI00300B8EF3